jgi:type I restriction enzyme S subunit
MSNVDKKTVSGERSVRLCNYTDVYYNERITAELPFMEATASVDQIARFGLRAGDVLLTKNSETPDDIAVPAYVVADLPDVVCGYHLALLRPGREVDGRYLFWALSSRSSREQFSASANGITRFGRK